MILPVGTDRAALGLVTAGLALLYFPAYVDLSQTIWATDKQGHGPIILIVSLWLLYQKRHEIASLPTRASPRTGWLLLLLSLLSYSFGRSQDITIFAIGSQVTMIIALLLIFKGTAAVRSAWFPLFFMLFMIPLPETLVAAVTTPLKSAVSAVGTSLLYAAGYPIGRSGVILTIGPYQLQVADACAGLNSMFTLEALGMLYMNLMKYSNPVRNVALAAILVPAAFVSNIVRVLILVLVTYYFGDGAGQGFIHNFAGMVLFMTALFLMFVVDRILGIFIPATRVA